MKIACYTLAYNEELILPHFIDHYKKFCDKIVIYNNMSTDNTKQIALDSGCEVIDWIHEGFQEDFSLSIKSNCYKQDRGNFDWVITVDCDEFYTHKEGLDSLIPTLETYKKSGVTIPDVDGYDMFSWDHDLTKPLSLIKRGSPSKYYSKLCIFDPKVDMRWRAGCHECFLSPDSATKQIQLRHYKFINFNYVINRYKELSSRQSELDRQKGYSYHFHYNKDAWLDHFKSLELTSQEI